MPGGVEDLSAEVQAVHADLVSLASAPRAHAPGLERAAGGAVLPRGLEGRVALGVAIKHPEEVVIGPGHDLTENGEMKNKKKIRQISSFIRKNFVFMAMAKNKTVISQMYLLNVGLTNIYIYLSLSFICFD